MALIDDLEAAISKEHDLDSSIITLLDTIHQELVDALASNDPTRLQAAVDMLGAEQQRISDAVTLNADPAVPVPPVTPPVNPTP